MGYCIIHKWYNGEGCPKCFPPDDCPSCAAKDAVVDAVRVYLLGNQHTCPDDCSSYNALSSALAAYDKEENDDRAK